MEGSVGGVRSDHGAKVAMMLMEWYGIVAAKSYVHVSSLKENVTSNPHFYI